MKRHPNNKNLRITYSDSYLGRPVLQFEEGLIINYLWRIEQTLKNAFYDHSRSFFIRVDLRFPRWYQRDSEISYISDFLISLKDILREDQENKRKSNVKVHSSNLRYVWVKEQSESTNPHFHVMLMVNRDAYRALGKFDSPRDTMANRVLRAWSYSLGIDLIDARGSVYFPENGCHDIALVERDGVLSEDFKEGYNNLFKHLSYFAKVRTKVYGDRSKNFGCSQK